MSRSAYDNVTSPQSVPGCTLLQIPGCQHGIQVSLEDSAPPLSALSDPGEENAIEELADFWSKLELCPLEWWNDVLGGRNDAVGDVAAVNVATDLQVANDDPGAAAIVTSEVDDREHVTVTSPAAVQSPVSDGGNGARSPVGGTCSRTREKSQKRLSENEIRREMERPRKRPKIMPDDDDGGGGDGDEKEKYERRKEQNRRAAARCRQKKKQRDNETEKELKRFREENEGLESEIAKLFQEKAVLEQALSNHQCLRQDMRQGSPLRIDDRLISD